MISRSGCASPGGLTALYRHCIHRPELEREPSFSKEAAQGSMKTSVLILEGSLPGPFQKDPVSLSKRLTLTSQSRFSRALRTLLALAPEQAGFCPQAKKPLIFPLAIWSKSTSQEPFCVASSFGSHPYPK